jgi:hypothetical protein
MRKERGEKDCEDHPKSCTNPGEGPCPQINPWGRKECKHQAAQSTTSYSSQYERLKNFFSI